MIQTGGILAVIGGILVVVAMFMIFIGYTFSAIGYRPDAASRLMGRGGAVATVGLGLWFIASFLGTG